jgi:hypothetical protein
MAKLPPVTQEFRADVRHITGAIDIVVKHLTAMRDELLAHEAEHPAKPEESLTEL